MFPMTDITTATAYGRGGYGAQSGARDGNGELVVHSDVSGPGNNGFWTGFVKGPDGPIVKDSGQDAIEKLASELNMTLDSETKDYLTQYYLQEHSNEAAWKRQMDASNTQYQRAVEDLRKAGINPFLAISSLSGSAPSSNGQGVSGGLYTSRKNQSTQNAKDVIGKIMSVLGIVAAAVIAAL